MSLCIFVNGDKSKYEGIKTPGIFANQTGNQKFMPQAVVMMALDHLAYLTDEASIMLILSEHCHSFKKD